MERKNIAFSQTWVFEKKFGLRTMHPHMFLVRYRKYGLRGSRNYETCAGIAQTSFQAPKTIFKLFSQLWGQIASEGISCTWILMHMVKANHLEFIDKTSKLCAGNAQARYLVWKMKKSEKQYHSIGS